MLQAVEAIGKSVDITSIDFQDETLKLFRDGETSGVFQFESSGMKDLLVKAHPNNFEDLIALIALFRPSNGKYSSISGVKECRY